jgi:murein L,D-transpeptidase YafK
MVYVYKDRRRLLVFEDDILIRDFPVALGSTPVGDKRKRGDGCTPEGEFAVCLKNAVSKYNKSLWLNYPGPKHAEEALLSGLLSYREYLSIIGAHKKMQRPPWTTSLGGGICIHGGGAHEDWTEGCVALYNFDMNELFKIVKTGTPVLILP